jgi:chemotaxis protein MotB
MALPIRTIHKADIPAPDPIESADLVRRRRKTRQPTNADDSEAWLISYADMVTLLLGFFIMLQSISKVDSTQFEKVKFETTKMFGGEYRIPFDDLSKKLKEKVFEQNLRDQVVFEQTPTGVNITFRGALFFDSGSADLKPEARKIIEDLVPVISTQAKDFGIIIEGHTDNRPINGGVFASNWELSSTRACSVLRLFEAKGFNRRKLKALGWGDTHPILPNEDGKGKPLPDNQAQNRRIIIKVLKEYEVN